MEENKIDTPSSVIVEEKPVVVEKVVEKVIEKIIDKPKEDEYYDVPIECFRDFNIPIESVTAHEISQLKDIVNWAKEISVDGYMKVINDLKRQLGTPPVNERAYDRVWRYVKMQRCINGLFI